MANRHAAWLEGATPFWTAVREIQDADRMILGLGIADVDGNELVDFAPDPAAVNYLQIETPASGSGPVIRAVGDDANIDLNLNSKGTGNIVLDGRQVIDSTVVAPSEGHILRWVDASSEFQNFAEEDHYAPEISGTTEATGSDDADSLLIYDDSAGATRRQTRYNFLREIGILYDSNDNPIHEFEGNAAGVNYVKTQAAITGFPPALRAQGSDTNVSLALAPKGTGTVQIAGSEVATIAGTQSLTNKTLVGARINDFLLGDDGSDVLELEDTPSDVNYVKIVAAATGAGPQVRAQGTDTDVDLHLAAKNAGMVRYNGSEIITTNQQEYIKATESGSTTLATSATDVPMATTIVNSGDFTVTSGDIQFDRDGVYLIEFFLAAENTGAGAHWFRLQANHDIGAGDAIIADLQADLQAGLDGSLHWSHARTYLDGQTVSLRGYSDHATEVITQSGVSYILITRLGD